MRPTASRPKPAGGPHLRHVGPARQAGHHQGRGRADGSDSQDRPGALQRGRRGLRHSKANMFDTVWVCEGWAVQNAKVQNYDVNLLLVSSRSTTSLTTTRRSSLPTTTLPRRTPTRSRPSCAPSRRATSSASRTPATPPTSSATRAEAARTSCTQARTTSRTSTSPTLLGLGRHRRQPLGQVHTEWLNDQGLVQNQLDVNKGYDLVPGGVALGAGVIAAERRERQAPTPAPATCRRRVCRSLTLSWDGQTTMVDESRSP